jgi:Animal haem peroxidase
MSPEQDKQSGGISRRKFLRALGMSVVVSGTASVLPVRAAHAQRSQHRRFVIPEDRFGRLFPQLRPFAPPSPELNAALMELGQPGGILDANDDLAAGPVNLIADPALSRNNPNSTTHTAGTTFMGQFMDHDMTFDLTSRLGEPTNPEKSINTRTPAFDLDSVYGGGPSEDCELYEYMERGHAPKFKIECGGLFEDLPRRKDGTAIIADPRNDENLMIAGLHAAFLLFHNKAVDLIEESDQRASPDEVFRQARQLTTWHYQWMILHEFPPLFVGQELVNRILAQGRRFYQPEEAFMRVEFQGAVYRFGHSMVRPSYRANLAGDNGNAFFGMIFDPAGEGQADPVDLRGGARAPRRFIGWQTFFDFGPTFIDPNSTNPAIRSNKQIDTKLSTPLFNLPRGTIPAPDGPTSLPQRNLLRHVTWLLPSGQSIARAMHVEVLAPADLSELKDLDQQLHLDESTPLWYYTLKEAELVEHGRQLGPVGGRIVGEVIIGLLDLDRHSFLSVNRRWRPTLPTTSGQVTGEFQMIDFLTFAGVGPASRKQ